MGAVRRLATVVIIGLVALSTLMVVYLAAEPNRRSSETTEQDLTAIERGTDLYITYCLQCHGPAGLGYMGQEDPARVGAPLNQDAVFSEETQAGLNANYQSDDPVQQAVAEDWLRYRITYGVPAEPNVTEKVMPAFGNDLNVEELNDLVYLIMNGDWDYVYNTAVHDAGVAVAEAECAENPDGEYCDDVSQAPPAYPTVPAPAPAEDQAEDEPSQEGGSTEAEAAQSGEADPASTGAEQDAGSGGEALSLEAQDISWSETEITVKPGDTIEMTNTGMLEHDFTVDELGIQEITESNGDTVTITIPEDAAPGDYEFYCSVPGHKEAGMVGTLTIEAP